jgi:hypothetical protein
LELARDHDFPDGSRKQGYDFTAPLANDGRISEKDWKANRARCRVRRFWIGETDEVGLLGDPDDDEAGYRLANHRFVPRRIRLDQGA